MLQIVKTTITFFTIIPLNYEFLIGVKGVIFTVLRNEYRVVIAKIGQIHIEILMDVMFVKTK